MVEIINESGFYPALYGLGLSYGKTSKIFYGDFIYHDTLNNSVYKVSKNLYNKDGGHNKFLESMEIWMIVEAPRFWWSEADTYRLSTKQSESTMHTIKKQILTQDMFYQPIEENYLNYLNNKMKCDNIDIEEIKNDLPEGFLQSREWKLSYNVLRNIIKQRKNHRLKSWQLFCQEVLEQVEHKEYFEDLK